MNHGHQLAVPVSTPSFGPKPTAQGVRGYRDLTDGEIELINTIKACEEMVAARWGVVDRRTNTDRRWLAVARTHFQEGFTALVRSIAQPRDPFGEQFENNAQDVVEGKIPGS